MSSSFGIAPEALADRLRGYCEERILWAGALLQRADEPEADFGTADLALRDAWLATRKGLRVTTLFREPEHALYDPVQVLRDKAFQSVPVAVEGAARRYCSGDEAQVVEGVRLVMESFSLGDGGRLRAEVAMNDGVPRVVLTLSGRGAPPRGLSLDEECRLSFDDFALRWIGATAGGHVALSDDAVMLYLEGDRPAPELHLHRPELAFGFARAEKALRSWRAASGHYEPGYADPNEVRSIYLEAIADALDGLNSVG